MIFESRVEGEIDAEDIHIGRGVVIEPGVLITGKSGSADRVVIGDFAYIGRDTRVMTPSFSLGDYSKIHARCFAHGIQPLNIGRNCWIGGDVVLDSMGGLDIDDNVGIGAQSQLWTHIQFGDIVEGSRFYSRKYMHVGKDSWFVGHCVVSPVSVAERSMAMLGSVVTRDMLANRVYAGVPARDVTERMGPQFEERTVEEKARVLVAIVEEFSQQFPECEGRIVVATGPHERDDERTWFDVSTRTYSKLYRPAEVSFLRRYTPLVKFTPDGVLPWLSEWSRGNPEVP